MSVAVTTGVTLLGEYFGFAIFYTFTLASDNQQLNIAAINAALQMVLFSKDSIY